MTIPQGGRKVKSATPPSLVAQAHELTGRQGPKRDALLVADQMPADLRAEFAAAINDHTVPAAGLARAVTARGYKISEQSISRFRLDGKVLT
jgi:hypothetical protein